MRLKNVRSNLNRFGALLTAVLAEAADLSEDKVRGLRNLIRDNLRKGGDKNRGFSSILPTGDKDQDVSGEVITEAFDVCKTTGAALVSCLREAGEVKSHYTHKGEVNVVMIPTSDFPELGDNDWEDLIDEAQQPETEDLGSELRSLGF